MPRTSTALAHRCVCALLPALIATASSASAQSPDYFQQEADYRISVELEPATHTLTASGTLTYTNHAPHALDSIAIHLWANAHADRDSPLGEQLLRLGRTDLAFAPDDQLGGYRSLTFATADGLAVDYPNPELAWLTPSRPLRPGDSLAIEFAYELRVPKTFSRLGRSGPAYAITQWFPKPAVYDELGWHVMPYLDTGEFFSEFGDYDVEITVPTNGMVAATGALVNPPGITARELRIAHTKSDPARVDSLTYAEGATTYRYRADDVHDFAWFVDPRFRIGVDTARLSTAAVPAYAYYPASAEPELWAAAPSRLARAVGFADSLVGAYPYPHITAVRGPLSAGGGMEYPMITIIGANSNLRELDEVLAHETYHNYFQGLLASNERLHTWMDEGLTSYLTHRYVSTYYPPIDTSIMILDGILRLGRLWSSGYLLHAGLAGARRHPRPDVHADSVTNINYLYAGYMQPQALFVLLDDYLGGEEFESRLRDYYERWRYRHPDPDDLRAALGGTEVDWLFDDLLLDNALPDYRIEAAEPLGEDSVRLTVRNVAGVASPFPVAVAGPSGEYETVGWVDGFAGTRTIAAAAPAGTRRVAVDPHYRTPEIDRDDNYYNLASRLAPKLEPIKLAALTDFNVGDRNVVNLVPVIGLNTADRFLLGLGIHNYSVLSRPTRYYVVPQLATRDASLNGLAGLKHSVYSDRAWWREWQLSLEGRSYHYHYDQTYAYSDRFARLTLGTDLLLAAEAGLPLDRRFGLRAHLVGQGFAVGEDAEAGLFREESRGYAIAEAEFTQVRNDALRPYDWRIAAQGGEGFARLSSTLEIGWRYREAPNFVRLRAFAGAFLVHDEPEVRALLLPNGVTGFVDQQYDYTFEQFIYDRAEQSQQIYDRDGSLSLPFLLPVPGSESWLASATATVDAPVDLGPLRLQAYLDAAVYPDTRPGAGGTVLPVTGGGRLSLFEGAVSISLAAFNNGFVREALPFTIAEPNYWDRVAFRLDLTRANVDELLRWARG